MLLIGLFYLLREIQGPQALRARPDQRERQERADQQERLNLQALRDRQDPMVLMGLMEQRVLQDLRGPQEQQRVLGHLRLQQDQLLYLRADRPLQKYSPLPFLPVLQVQPVPVVRDPRDLQGVDPSLELHPK